MRSLLALLACATVSGCALSIPEDYFGCSMSSDCPPGWFCNSRGRCVSAPDAVDASLDTGARLDAGRDASVDASRLVDAPSAIDAASDVGSDAGEDASVDTGETDLVDAAIVIVDAGTDAGTDAGNDGGRDAGHDASTWNPSGVYASTGASYSCAAFDLNVLSWTYTDDGSTLRISDPTHDVACDLTGPTARATGTFDTTCMVDSTVVGLPGICTATYHLAGAFTGDDTWTATLTASFAGSGMSCGSSPDTCRAQTLTPVTGSR